MASGGGSRGGRGGGGLSKGKTGKEAEAEKETNVFWMPALHCGDQISYLNRGADFANLSVFFLWKEVAYRPP